MPPIDIHDNGTLVVGTARGPISVAHESRLSRQVQFLRDRIATAINDRAEVAAMIDVSAGRDKYVPGRYQLPAGPGGAERAVAWKHSTTIPTRINAKGDVVGARRPISSAAANPSVAFLSLANPPLTGARCILNAEMGTEQRANGLNDIGDVVGQ
jgi:hypothetical protein